MEGLAAASRESYQRAYPLLLRLHMLSEAEAGVELLRSSRDGRLHLAQKQEWTGRLQLLSPSLPLRAPLIALRRIIFTIAGLDDIAFNDLLSYSKLARVGGNFTLAKNSWRQAKSLSSNGDLLLIPEAKLLHAKGKVAEAIQVIEPSEKDIAVLRENIRQRVSGGEVTMMGRRLLYSTDWKVEAGHIHGNLVFRLQQNNGNHITHTFRM